MSGNDTASFAPNAGDLKYAPGASARLHSPKRSLRTLEWIVLVHTTTLLVGTTWAFGGQHDLAQTLITWWGSLGALITFSALQDRAAWKEGWMRPLSWLIPFTAFNAFVLLGCINPSFREAKYEGETVMLNVGGWAGFPSSARPMLGLKGLWLFDALWISCFNLALVLRQRRAIRLLLLIAVSNAAALAVFGTVQKLSHAKGLFFDTVPTRQIFFFASFVYHNHWGAFMLLMISSGLALTWHYGRRKEARDFFHTPAFGGIVVILLLAVTVPLSGSRSSSILATILFGAALAHWIVRLVKVRRQFNESVALPLIGVFAALLIAGGAVWFVAKESIVARLSKSSEQISEMQAIGGLGARAQLYGDTWRMAKKKLLFGWGMASYPHVFTLFNSRESRVDRLPVFYNDAHSDWLQASAEHGLVGTSLLALCAIVPLLRLRRHHFASSFSGYLLGGCALLLIYGWVEFPFGNVAVVLSWWLCFFCAVHYARLQDREATGSRSASTHAHSGEV